MKTLKDLPQKREETISLIERAFDYSSINSFETDFYPLMRTENASNNYILIEDNIVIGHIGVLYKSLVINEKSFLIPMLGGIAIAENYRGKGKFKPFFKEVLAKLEDSPFSLLWSDKIDLYKSFNFYPCIEQYEYTGSEDLDNPNFIKMKLSQLTDNELLELESIYNQASELRYTRTQDDWIELKYITSSDIYIKRDNKKITNYFFMNKGEDLTDIIYEYGLLEDIEEISTYGILWSPWSFDVDDEEHKSLLYAAMLKVNNLERFQQFISLYTDEMIMVNSAKDQEVQFTFEEKKMKLSEADFVQGVFGPNKFEELENTKKILISGLDSI